MHGHSYDRWRFWRALPRWLIVTIGVLLLTTLVVYSSFRIFKFEGSVDVVESVQTSDSLTFTLEMFPNETRTVQRTLRNIGPVDVRVDLILSYAPTGQGVSAQLSAQSFIIIAGSSKIFNIVVSATNDAIPGTYTITVDVFRSVESPSNDGGDDG